MLNLICFASEWHFFNLLKENELIFQTNYDFSSLLMGNNEKSTDIINLKQLSKYAKLPE